MTLERDSAPPGADGAETDLRARFGERLREVRRERGLTQAAVAGLAGLTQQYVAMIESGRIDPTLDTMVAGRADPRPGAKRDAALIEAS